MQFKFKDIAQNFNASNFLVYFCLLLFSVLLSLRADGVISWNLALVFLPLWVWNTLTLVGLIVGVAFWIKKRNLRQDSDHRHHFVAMVQCAILQFPLFLTELLVVINAETGNHRWTAIFTPMYLLSLLSIGACILSCCLKRVNYEFEVLSIASLIQLLFIGIRLDGFVTWSWAEVLIPTWILVIVLFLCVVIYGCVIKCCLFKIEENQENIQLRKLLTALFVVSLFIAVICFILFLALLTTQLDGRLSAPYTATFVPLHITILALLVTTVTRQNPANQWWFGLHKNFVDFLLDSCPPLQEYANISVSHRDVESAAADSSGRSSEKSKHRSQKVTALTDNVYPYEDLMMPD